MTGLVGQSRSQLTSLTKLSRRFRASKFTEREFGDQRIFGLMVRRKVWSGYTGIEKWLFLSMAKIRLEYCPPLGQVLTELFVD